MSWNKFSLPATGIVSPKTGLAAVSRIPNSMEVWYVGAQGSIEDSFWYDGGTWQHFQLAPPASASITGGIAAVSRISNSMEVWHVGLQGSIEDHFWYDGANWQGFQLAPPGSAALTSHIAAVSRIPNSMELWWIGQDGSVQGAFWYEGGNWTRYQLAPPGSASLTGGIAAVSRIPNSMELWYVGSQGSIEDCFWYEGSNWQNFQLAPPGSASLTGSIGAVSRIPNSMELWYVGAQGSVEDCFWYEGGNWQHFQLAPPGSASLSGGVSAVARIPTSMEVWHIGPAGSVEDHFWYEGINWQNFQLAPAGSASATTGIAVVSRIPNSMELWCAAPAGGSMLDNFWYQDPAQLPTLSSANNSMLINNCVPLQNVGVKLDVSQDLITYQDTGFSLQLNAYPPAGQLSQGQTLNWLQYIIYVEKGTLFYEIQYWSIGAPSAWPSGYTPNPPNTTPWLPVFPNDYFLTSFGSAPNNRIPRGSALTIQLTTDRSGNVTNAQFTVAYPGSSPASVGFPFPQGTQYPIDAFEVNLVGPGNFANATFISGAGTLTYNTYPGQMTIQSGGPGSNCSEVSAGTGEGSNIVYGNITPSGGGPTLTQSVSFIWQGTAAASGSDLDGYWLKDNTQHVNYVSIDGHIHELFYVPGGSWIDNDLTASAKGTPAAPGSALDGYWGSDTSQHVNFISIDGHVHELFYHPGATAWADNDLTAIAKGQPAVAGSALDGYWLGDNTQHVNFTSLDGHVHELFYHPGATAWADNDLTVISKGTPAAAVRPNPEGRFHSIATGSSLDGYWLGDNTQHVNFVSVDGHVHELFYLPGSNWVDNDLTARAHGALAAPGSSLDGYWGTDNSQHVNFISADGHVHELFYHVGATDWVDNDLTAFANGTPAVPGSPLDGYWGSDNSQHVNFISVDGHIHELFIPPGGKWMDNDLTAQT